MTLSTAQPKPVKRATAKRQRDQRKAANIHVVRDEVEARDGEMCRITKLLKKFGFRHQIMWGRLELAHLDARGMGGNPNLSRDTPENTLLVIHSLHQGGKYTMHGEYLKVRPLTDKGTAGPCCFEFYERLPAEVK